MTTLRTISLILLVTALAHTQVITTVAGADPVFLTTVQQALSASLNDAAAVAVDGSGNLYLADSVDNIVARVTPDGVFTVVAGNGRAGFSGDGGPASAASLNSPSGVAIDPAGNLYISDQANNRIRKVSGGIISTIAGTGSLVFSGEGGPAVNASFFPDGIAVDSSGGLFVADSVNQRILRIANGRLTTFAGNGKTAFAGDDGPALSASFNAPRAVAVTAAGVLYIVDTGNLRIRRVANSTIATVAGNGSAGSGGDGGQATAASFTTPVGIAVDSSGNLYIADIGNHRVRKIANGVINTIAGTGVPGFSGDRGPAASAQLFTPTGVAVDAGGSVYIADRLNRRIRKISSGTINTVVGSDPPSLDGVLATAAIFNPEDVAVDSSGNVYIADGPIIRKLSGQLLTTFAGGGTSLADGVAPRSARLGGSTHVAVDAAGNVYISDSGSNRVRKVSGGVITTVAGNGTAGLSGDNGPATAAMLSSPAGIAVSSAGDLYIADQGNNRVRKVSQGAITTLAGGGTTLNEGGPAISAFLSFPNGVAVDSSGNVYIADTANNRIRRVSSGTITTVAGNGAISPFVETGSATSATINSPKSVIVDSAGNLYISDTNNQRVRRVTAGNISTVAGNGVKTFAGDGGPATSASLSGPAGLALDAAGDLFFVDESNRRVREVLVRLPNYQVAPASLNFSATSRGAAPATQVVSLSTQVPGLAFTASVSASSPWLTVSATAGTIPTTLEVSADPSTLDAGPYQGTITIATPFALPASTTIAVTFKVEAAATPVLSLDAQNLGFTGFQGGDPLSQSLTVLNTGSGSFPYTASATAGDFALTVSPAGGTSAASSPATLTVTAAPGSLSPGTYSGSVTVNGAGSSVVVAVKLSVASPSASILLTQTALNFSAVAQGGVPLPQTFGILNTGKGSFSWTAEASTLSAGNWLKLSPTSGTVTQPFTDVSQVSVSVDPSGLDSGTYYGQIKVASVALNSPQVITVILSVLPPGTTAPPTVSPGALVFTSPAGVTPGSQDVQIGNPAGATASFLSGMSGPGFTYAPTSSRLAARQPTLLRVYPDFSNMTPGSVQRGSITLQFSDGSPAQKIPVLLIATTSSGSSAAVLQPRDSVDCHRQIYLSPTSPQQATSVAVGQPVSLGVKLTNGCGDLIGPGDKNSNTVTATFSGANKAAISMRATNSGVWEESWTPNLQGTTKMLMQAFVLLPGDVTVGGQIPTPYTIQVGPQTSTPVFTADGVAHSASGQAQATVAPGQLISIYGQNLADQVAISNDLPVPESLIGTVVTLGTVTLPIRYASPTQLNVQVPYKLNVDQFNQLLVQRGTALSVPRDLQTASAQPGIFTVSQTGTGQGAITKSDGVTIAQPGTPALIGETIVIYCTGLGSVAPAVKEGDPAPGLAKADHTVTVTIGGKPAAIDYSGLTPGSAGLYQINAVVPTGVTPGDAVPVIVTEANQSSLPVTIAVAAK